MNFKNVSPKNGIKLAFMTQNKAKLCTNLIISLFFEKNANFLAENCRKSQKIAIIASTPGHPGWRRSCLADFCTKDVRLPDCCGGRIR
jgi:hypothetical protein